MEIIAREADALPARFQGCVMCALAACHPPDRLTSTQHPSPDACRLLIYFFAGVSPGAPVPSAPRNNVRPSGSVRSRPFARSDPSFD